MNIIMPMDGTDLEESKICAVHDAKSWLYFEMNEGRMVNEKFYDTRAEVENFPEIVIVCSDKEDVWPFMEEGIAVLVAPMQRYIEDIVEAYLFKELHDLNQ